MINELTATRCKHTVGIVFIALALVFSKEVFPMDAPDPGRYFVDPKVAAFVRAVERGDVGAVNAALAAGMNPNAEGRDGFRPIHFVFFAKTADVLKVLLGAGADASARLNNGNTPLHFAVRMETPEFTRALLAAKADPNARGENNKPVIHEAVRFPQTENVSLLARHGADINVLWGGSTPLLAAVTIFAWPVAAVLLNLDADISFRNRAGKSAVDRFCEHVKRLAPTPANRHGVPLVLESLRARGIEPQCASQVVRFY